MLLLVKNLTILSQKIMFSLLLKEKADIIDYRINHFKTLRNKNLSQDMQIRVIQEKEAFIMRKKFPN